MACVKEELPSLANQTLGVVNPVLEKYETALLLLLGFGGFSLLLAGIHRALRKYVFHDQENVDTTFDAGGRVSTSLTAVTVASQFLWPGDLLQSSTITVKSGISGPFWYTVGAALNIALFPIVSVHLKTRAPGAKTYLQIMSARFGKAAHILFVALALLVNLCVISTLLVAGVATIQSLTLAASDEFCVVLIAVLFGSYCFIGGLGTTFYVSYFNAVLIFAILIAVNVKILYATDNESESIGSFEKIYSRMNCLLAPEGNQDRSYMTFSSENGIVWAFVGLCVTSTLTYCDQAAWQSRIAAKPLQGVVGFVIASYIWFAIPVSIATSTGLAYLSMSFENASNVLPLTSIDEGLVTPFVTQKIMGDVGSYLVIIMTAMTLMSTGSGEVMAVSSIIVYDIYQKYVNPFRSKCEHNDCVLCGRPRTTRGTSSQNNWKKDQDNYGAVCQCPNVTTCKVCAADVRRMAESKQDYVREYACYHHGKYRHYQDMLNRYKSWCILWVTVALVPLGLAVIASGINLNWAMLFGFIIALPCFPTVVLSIFWVKATGPGVIAGGIIGLIAGMSVSLGVASTYEGGLNNFIVNTVQNYSVVGGAASSIGVTFIVTIVVSLLTHKIKTKSDRDQEWQKLRDIDNPLHPWSELYKEDIPDLQKGERPSTETLDRVFRTARVVAYVCGAVTIVLYVGVIPGTMISLGVLTLHEFQAWTHVMQIFSFTMAALVIAVAPIEEVIQVIRQFKRNKKERRNKHAEKYVYEKQVHNSHM